MKSERRSTNEAEGNDDHKQAITEATEFHARRISQEVKINAKRKSSNEPVGNYEYEQMMAEDAYFSTKSMIEEAAFLIAEKRGFAPGSELSDWFQAETNVECLLRSDVINRRKLSTHDRRHEGRSQR